MGVYKRGKSHYIDFVYDGRRYSECVGPVSRTVAKEKLVIRRQEVIQGEWKPKIKKILFDDFAKRYMKYAGANKKPGSAKRNGVSIDTLKKHFDGKMLGDITPFSVEQFRKARREGKKAPATVNRDIATLRNMLNKAVEWKLLNHNPLVRVKMLKEDNEKMWVLTPEEEKRLIQACEDRPQREKYLPGMVTFALNTGMRLGEIMNLRVQDVRLKDRYVSVTVTKNTEGRNVPINATAIAILRKRIEDEKSEYVFCNEKGERLTVLTNAFWTAIDKAGLKRFENVRGELKEVRFRFHDLRHTFGSRLGMAGVDVKTIMEIMGHKTIKMALRYQHPLPGHKLNAVKLLDNISKTKLIVMESVKESFSS
ncbi:MAG TPA: tyrosine-type recombinase/integrase [Syntrophales bacterium]|nr:tyrosine-type recombinase/integrase [Syntrophales bacterium]HOX94503.1 tyrosine-type recombinase/integrase [Syntrophales bacterium]HPI57870.1 tyrosine-type recombinase/integrase [Syntrophales bacterium]HPN24528.1 tyrosine-type recombinase/integrase [Syntrophales bacterium]HQM28834.1 tyrosine-type recombinase/integrase [Syntrophales bacterium]